MRAIVLWIDDEAHAIRPDYQQARLAAGLPGLAQWRYSLSDHFFHHQLHTEHASGDSDQRSDGLPLQRIRLDSHAGASHHQRGLLHVAGQSTVIVQVRKEDLRVDGDIDLAAMVEGITIIGSTPSFVQHAGARYVGHFASCPFSRLETLYGNTTCGSGRISRLSLLV